MKRAKIDILGVLFRHFTHQVSHILTEIHHYQKDESSSLFQLPTSSFSSFVFLLHLCKTHDGSVCVSKSPNWTERSAVIRIKASGLIIPNNQSITSPRQLLEARTPLPLLPVPLIFSSSKSNRKNQCFTMFLISFRVGLYVHLSGTWRWIFIPNFRVW